MENGEVDVVATREKDLGFRVSDKRKRVTAVDEYECLN